MHYNHDSCVFAFSSTWMWSKSPNWRPSLQLKILGSATVVHKDDQGPKLQKTTHSNLKSNLNITFGMLSTVVFLLAIFSATIAANNGTCPTGTYSMCIADENPWKVSVFLKRTVNW